MSKLSLMIFTFVVLVIILCNHSACSQRGPFKVHIEPGNCPSCSGKTLKFPSKPWKCSSGNVECICWKTRKGSIGKRCPYIGGGAFYKVSTPL